MGFFNGNVQFLSISSCLGKKRFLKTLKKDFYINLIKVIMAKEIFTTAGVMWALTLTGLSVGFGLLKIQGE